MIQTFANRETAAIFAGVHVRRFSGEIILAARRKHAVLHRVSVVEELRIPPGNCLEKLGGNRKGQWSIRVNDQWRLCFRFEDGNAFDVELTDYH